MLEATLAVMVVAFLFVAAALAAPPTSPPPPPSSFVGVYHPATGAVPDGKNTSAFDLGVSGIVAIMNAPSEVMAEWNSPT